MAAGCATEAFNIAFESNTDQVVAQWSLLSGRALAAQVRFNFLVPALSFAFAL